jgi:outer membrane protein assembly factor BamB
LAVGSDKVVVTGFSDGSGNLEDYATIAYDAATGQPLWTKRYNGPANGYDADSSVAVSPDGSKVYVTGSNVRFRPAADYVTIAYATVSESDALWAESKRGPLPG